MAEALYDILRSQWIAAYTLQSPITQYRHFSRHSLSHGHWAMPGYTHTLPVIWHTSLKRRSSFAFSRITLFSSGVSVSCLPRGTSSSSSSPIKALHLIRGGEGGGKGEGEGGGGRRGKRGEGGEGGGGKRGGEGMVKCAVLTAVQSVTVRLLSETAWSHTLVTLGFRQYLLWLQTLVAQRLIFTVYRAKLFWSHL